MKSTKKIKSNRQSLAESSDINKSPPHKKQEILESHKSSLEKILKLIKESIFEIISNKNNKKSKSLKEVKEILIELNQTLHYKLEEKKINMSFFENLISEKKSSITNKIFVNKNKSGKYKSSKNQKIYNLKTELDLLKTFNFKAKNDINYINNTMIRKTNEYNYLKLYVPNSTLQEKEIACTQQKYYPIVTKILHKKLEEIHEKFKRITSVKQKQNKLIENINGNLIDLKNSIQRRKYNFYPNIKEIIKEESKEYTKTILNITVNNKNNVNNIISAYNRNKDKLNENEKGEDIKEDDYEEIEENEDDICNQDDSNLSSISSDKNNNNNKIQQTKKIPGLTLDLDKCRYNDDIKYNTSREQSVNSNLINQKSQRFKNAIPNILTSRKEGNKTDFINNIFLDKKLNNINFSGDYLSNSSDISV